MADCESAYACKIGEVWTKALGLTTKCSLCCNEVNIKSEPFLLPCLHTACKACLENDQDSLQCSLCEQYFNPKKAVRHLVLMERLEKESPEEKEGDEEDAKNPCTSCDEGVFAGGYCKDCEEWLCQACISAHQRVKVTKDHSILSTEQAGKALKTAARQKFLMCEKHTKEPLKFHCTKCNMLTCRDCQLEDHQNHGDYLALAAAWEQQKPQLRILQERIAEKQAFIREYITWLEDCQKANGKAESDVAQQIRHFTTQAITLINIRSKKLIREVQTICDYKRDALQYKRLDYLQLCKRLLDCHATIDDLITSGSDLALVHSKVIMEKYMESLIEKVIQLPNSKAKIDIKYNHDPEILKELERCGSIVDHSTLPVRGTPHASLRPPHNGQIRPPSAGVHGNGRSSASPQQTVTKTNVSSLPERPPSSSNEIKRPAKTPSPVEPSKEDVITGDVEPSNGARSPSSSASAVPGTMAEDNDISDDWCAVCHDGGELLCCGLCPKVYHLHCHVPSLVSTPSEDWKCTLCTPIQEDVACASKDGNSKRKIPVGLHGKQLKITEKILLQLFCHSSSTPFQTPVSRTVPNYFKIITRPMDLSTVKQKLSTSHFNHYESAAAFIQDINLIFSNCYTFNAKESPLAKQAQLLEKDFKKLIEKELPECVHDLRSSHGDDLPEHKRMKLV